MSRLVYVALALHHAVRIRFCSMPYIRIQGEEAVGVAERLLRLCVRRGAQQLQQRLCVRRGATAATAATGVLERLLRLCVRRGAVLPQLQLPAATAATAPLCQACRRAAPAPASGSSPSCFIFLRERRERERESASGVSGCIRRCFIFLHSLAYVSNKASSCIRRFQYQYDLN